ncbi:hypothetical protein IJI72_03055 [Candidatus Saccharibacteria bacterium]|nr:hypothetical protein [Candidatus Saccharibacteria bacterium]
MIKIFTGEDRGKLQEAVKRELGEEYEVFEGEELTTGDLPGIFFGATLFAGFAERRVVIRDLGENKVVFTELGEKIEEFVKTEAKVILVETKFDKRLSAAKKLAKAGVEVREFKMAGKGDSRAVFEIYDLALKDGAQAVRALEKIQAEQEPYMFFGLLASQALKRLEWRPNGTKERRAVKELAEVDMKMKTTAVEPWLLVKSFLVRLSSL